MITAQFTTATNHGDQIVTGYKSKHFGIYLNGFDFIIIHLKTGLSIGRKLPDFVMAKDVALELESAKFLISWAETDVDRLNLNRMKTAMVIDKAYKRHYGRSLVQ